MDGVRLMGMSDSTRRLLACLLLTLGVAGCDPNTTATPASSVATAPASPSAGVALPTDPPATSPVATTAPTTTPATTKPAPGGTTATPRSTPTATAATDRSLPLTLTRTGGLIGAQDQVTISANGTAMVSRDGAAPVRSSMSGTDLAQLRRLLADPALTQPATPSRKPGVCNDGYRYGLRTPGYSVVVDDCGRSRQPAFDQILDLVLPLLKR
jgi:hypothetical protein